jgi:hypothetical protein
MKTDGQQVRGDRMEHPTDDRPVEKPLLTDSERIEQAGLESFPASDAPSWNSGVDRPRVRPRTAAPPAVYRGLPEE